MKRTAIWFSFIIGLSLLWPAVLTHTQSPGVEAVITQVDGPSPQAGPNVTAYVSVVADVKSAITGLPAGSFTVSRDGQEVQSVSTK